MKTPPHPPSADHGTVCFTRRKRVTWGFRRHHAADTSMLSACPEKIKQLPIWVMIVRHERRFGYN